MPSVNLGDIRLNEPLKTTHPKPPPTMSYTTQVETASQVDLMLFSDEKDFSLLVEVTYNLYEEVDGDWFNHEAEVTKVEYSKWNAEGDKELEVTEADKAMAQEFVNEEEADAFENPTLERWV